MRKKLPALVLACFLVFVAPLTVSAHTGRTDNSGGHRDSSTGDYNYHHGYEAHQHYDMDGDGVADCPYDFDNQTNHESGSSSSNSKSDKNPTEPNFKSSPTQTTNPKSSNGSTSSQNAPTTFSAVSTESKGGTKSMLGWLVSAALGIALTACIIHNDREFCRLTDSIRSKDLTFKKEKSKYEAELAKLNSSVSYWASKADEYKSLANDLQAKLSECESKLLHIERISVGDSNESLSDRNMALSIQVEEKDSVIQQMSNELKICKTICRIPKSVSFYRDGMPVFHSPDPARPYGEWTVYINRRSCIYHLDYYCSPYSSERSHLFSVLGTDIRPCKKCASGKIRFPDVPLWYKNYLDVEPQAKELGFLGRTLSADLDYFDSMKREDRSDFFL